jgi:hypothetical protein
MDPDEALRQLRAAIGDYRTASNLSMSEEAADRVAEYEVVPGLVEVEVAVPRLSPAVW